MTLHPALTALRSSLFGSRRRGVVSVLAMMFLVLFGSLGLAMAIVSKGNLRTASTHMHVTKAIGAAETGLAIGAARLAEAASRFVVDKGVIDASFGRKLWDGSLTAGDCRLTVLAPPSGHGEFGTPRGVAQALYNAHAADQNVVAYSGGLSQPVIGSAPAGSNSATYRLDTWVTTPAIAIDGSAAETGARPAAFQLTYAPLADGVTIRVIATGFSSVGTSGSSYIYGGGSVADQSRPLSRVIYQDFKLSKRHQHAIVSPSRVLIGKNVNITGSMGAAYTDVARQNGDPAVLKSDFMGLDPVLDRKLQDLFTAIRQYDVDGDNRLRVTHATEGAGLPSNSSDYDNDGRPDNAFADATRDGYVDDFDVFINHYDRNGDRRLTLSGALTAGTPAEGQTPEFAADDDLALLIDSYNPDRNRNGVAGFKDDNNNGRWDPGEALTDYDSSNGTFPDRVLGWRDGYIDGKDAYAKVHGRLVFRATQNAWNTARSPNTYQNYVQGAIAPPRGQTATQFGATSDVLPDVSVSNLTAAQTPLTALADGQSFNAQVAAQLGVSAGALATYTETKTNPASPRFFRADMDNAAARALTGQNLWEKMPFNSPQYTDWYIRPRYENMVFRNVQIPEGNNGLFVNCTFVGVTWVRTYTQNTHELWSLYGGLQWSAASGRPVPNTAPLDKSDFLRYTTGLVTDGPQNYGEFADPPVIYGVTRTGAARDTKRYSNNIRFHNCLFVGSVVSDTPQAFTHVRNKMQFTGSTRFSETHPDQPGNGDLNPNPEDRTEIAKSSMMLPNYSVDIGQFNSPTDTFADGPPGQNVQLSGTIIAGVLDARGNTSIEGTLLLTFAPRAGEGPLQQYGVPVGNPSNFNASLGYFGPADGELESLDPQSLPIVGGRRIVGWDTDGDGLPDVSPNDPQPAGSSPVPFYGYGRVNITWSPDRAMPDGIMLPVSVVPVAASYREQRP
ncbi:MAG: hypothetical protein JNJ48_04915 [Phycisphaerae bacterium]|nr:hypothetical protein [Phycisphaerae bacterium]